jgi:hypothetical protein
VTAAPAGKSLTVILAPNPSVFTGRGTNRYVLGNGTLPCRPREANFRTLA